MCKRQKKIKETNKTTFHYLNIFYFGINNAGIYLNKCIYLLFKY